MTLANQISAKIPDTSKLVKNTDYNAKISEIESKIPSISGLVTTSALTSVENKISDVSGLVKKTDYNTKNSEIEKKLTDHDHDKYITTPEFNKFTAEICYLFVNDTEIIKFKAKGSQIVATSLCLGNISKDFSVDNMRNTGLYG